MVNKPTQPITRELLATKTLAELRRVYHTLSDKDGSKLNRDELEEYIYLEMNPTIKKVKTMTDKKTYTPNEIAKAHGISPVSVRKIVRSLFKKPEGEQWALTEDQVAKILQVRKENAAKAAENRAHSVERLKEWRAAHPKEAKKAPTKEADKAAPDKASTKPVAKPAAAATKKPAVKKAPAK